MQAYDMTIESIICKLMWAMSITREYDSLRNIFYKPVLEDILTQVD
jgi:L-asparaginase